MINEAGKTGKESEVKEFLNGNHRRVDKLTDVVSQLKERLSSVLRVATPEPACETKEARTLVPLAEDLKGLCDGISQETTRLEDILNRLEL